MAGAHRKLHGRRSTILGVSCAVAGALVIGAAGATYGLSRQTGTSTHTAAHPQAAAARTSTTTSTTTIPDTPLTVKSISPAPGVARLAVTGPIRVTFSAAVAAAAPSPTLSPAVAGSWSRSGATMTFTPAIGFVPDTTVKITVPAGITGATGTHTTALAAAHSATFKVADGSTLRLQQLLAMTGYLPVRFTASAGAAHVYSSPAPVAGKFSWRYPNTPAPLVSHWAAGAFGSMTRGAVMSFENDHGLVPDGVAGPQVWTALLHAAWAHQSSPHPYNVVIVSERSPESLQVWSDGHIIASSPANTGVAGAATPPGIYPVYARYASTTMKGTNPDGTHYNDHGVPWVAYFYGGDAVHGFPRASYGSPQSNGCVELPIAAAKAVWGTDPLGTLVTVEA